MNTHNLASTLFSSFPCLGMFASLRNAIILTLLPIALSMSHITSAANNLSANQQAFWLKLTSFCGERFEGESVFHSEGNSQFANKKLIAEFALCSAHEIRIPFSVGEDKSRTWIVTKTPQGLQFKHDHRKKDGSPDEITMYGGMAGINGTESSASFPADEFTIKLIPEAATNIWHLTLSPDNNKLIYYLERNSKPRFKAELYRKMGTTESIKSK